MKILFIIPPCEREILGVNDLVGFLRKSGLEVKVCLLDYKQIAKQILKINGN